MLSALFARRNLLSPRCTDGRPERRVPRVCATRAAKQRPNCKKDPLFVSTFCSFFFLCSNIRGGPPATKDFVPSANTDFFFLLLVLRDTSFSKQIPFCVCGRTEVLYKMLSVVRMFIRVLSLFPVVFSVLLFSFVLLVYQAPKLACHLHPSTVASGKKRARRL